MSLMKLINYGTAAMAVLPFLFLTAQGLVMISNAMKVPYGWAPLLAVIVLISVGIYHWSNVWITQHENSQKVSFRVEAIPASEAVEENTIQPG